MQANKTVKINGRLYDAVTGLPVAEKTARAASAKTEAVAPTITSPETKQSKPAASIHASPQRSQTLHRRATKKPGPPKRPQPGKHMDIARSNRVARFAPHPIAAPVAESTPDIAHTPHPVVKRAVQRVEKKPVSIPTTAKQVKEIAIAKALAPALKPSKKATAKPASKKRRITWSRKYTILTALFAVLITAATVTYFNLPSLSVALAASQSGVAATYPKYVPDGYSLSQPVTFSDNQVSLKFTSNSGAGEYTINQAQSSWDSSAVLDNVVRKEAGDNYVINQERGLTVYAYDGNAAWVSGGILYTIVSSAPLSSDQIRRIATSL